MTTCASCGKEIAEHSAFCQHGGVRREGATGSPPQAAPAQPGHAAGAGLAANVASGLCYVLGWITGVVMLIVDDRPAVLFHAVQSIIVFGALSTGWWEATWAWAGSLAALTAGRIGDSAGGWRG